MGRAARCALVVLTGFLAAGSARTQQGLTFQFSFSNPGARSMGFGGAFAALADDATAAYANPAGLVQLAEPEACLEGRSWSYSTPFTAGGRAAGTPTGIGLDTAGGLIMSEAEADLTALSFASFVYPLGRGAIAVYRHQLAKFEASVESQALFAPGNRFAGTARNDDHRSFNSTDIVSTGIAGAFRPIDSLSLGIGVVHFSYEHIREGSGYKPDDDSLESFFGPSSFLPERQAWHILGQGEGSDWSVNLGVLWRTEKRWSVGGFYRRGFEVEVTEDRRAGVDPWPDTPEYQVTFSNEVPDVYGLGLGFRSVDGRVTASLEWDRVKWGPATESDPDEAIPDADELHLGAEYAFLRSKPVVAVRAGAWLDPNHRIRATAGDAFFRAIHPPGEDEIHSAVGLGLAFKTFQIDIGADFSDSVDTASISAVYSF